MTKSPASQNSGCCGDPSGSLDVATHGRIVSSNIFAFSRAPSGYIHNLAPEDGRAAAPPVPEKKTVPFSRLVTEPATHASHHSSLTFRSPQRDLKCWWCTVWLTFDAGRGSPVPLVRNAYGSLSYGVPARLNSTGIYRAGKVEGPG